MISDGEMSGIYLVTARTATGRVLDCAGTDDEVDFWLGELGNAETIVDVARHEMTDAEVDAYRPVYDSPGADPEKEGA